MIELIIFDMDGLMFDTEQLGLVAWKKAGEKFNFKIPDEVVIKTIGTDLPITKISFDKILSKYNNYDFYMLFNEREKIIKDYLVNEKVPTKKGLYELVSTLNALNIKKAIATSSNKARTLEFLSSADLSSEFDVVITGDMVQRRKPYPDLFLLASKIAQVSPHRCIVLEDTAHGILAATNAEMKSILIPDIQPISQDAKCKAMMQCNNLFEVIPIVRKLIDSRG